METECFNLDQHYIAIYKEIINSENLFYYILQKIIKMHYIHNIVILDCEFLKLPFYEIPQHSK